MSVKVTKNDIPRLLREIQALTGKTVLVGIPEDSAEREDGAPISNATIGYLNEYGSPAQNIPPRPFLIPGVQKAQDKVAGQLGKGAAAALEGDAATTTAALTAAGLIAQSSVKDALTHGEFTPLADSTLKARKRKGFAGEKPLIVTGSLRNAITFVVEETKK